MTYSSNLFSTSDPDKTKIIKRGCCIQLLLYTSSTTLITKENFVESLAKDFCNHHRIGIAVYGPDDIAYVKNPLLSRQLESEALKNRDVRVLGEFNLSFEQITNYFENTKIPSKQGSFKTLDHTRDFIDIEKLNQVKKILAENLVKAHIVRLSPLQQWERYKTIKFNSTHLVQEPKKKPNIFARLCR